MKLIFPIFFLFFSSCSLFEKKIESPDQILDRVSHQKIFYAPYDEVWRAAHASVRYTIASENQDFGVIETDFVKGIDGWLPPFLTKPENPGSRYKLVLNFARGNTNGKESVRVNIDKKIEVFRSVISDVDTVASDGLEEKMLFYRMERELIIGQALRKAAAATSSQ
jgi:hypothetical protein